MGLSNDDQTSGWLVLVIVTEPVLILTHWLGFSGLASDLLVTVFTGMVTGDLYSWLNF